METRRSAPANASDGRGPGPVLRRWAGLLAGLVVVSALHYVTDPERAWLHNIYQRLYYLPIVLGAYWFGVRGGLLTALAAAVAYVPHIAHTWHHNVAYAASQYVELFIFLSAGGLVGFLSDTQRKIAQELRASHEQLRRADRLSALGEIAASLAHELRNPLAGIKGAVEIVAGKVRPGTPEAEFTGIAATELQRLDALVGEFLAYARPRVPEFRSANLPVVVHQVLALVKPESERVSVSVVVHAAADVPALRMDPEQIQQVVFNMILNGIQASPARGLLDVRVLADAAWVHVVVTDQGPGIPEELRSRLFEPFFTTKPNGTGLGLAVSQRIVTAHGGRLQLEPAPGGGCAARLSLPLGGPTEVRS